MLGRIPAILVARLLQGDSAFSHHDDLCFPEDVVVTFSITSTLSHADNADLGEAVRQLMRYASFEHALPSIEGQDRDPLQLQKLKRVAAHLAHDESSPTELRHTKHTFKADTCCPAETMIRRVHQRVAAVLH